MRERPVIDIGFTGTQIGMTAAQAEGVWRLLYPLVFRGHHGDCIGSDATFDEIARRAPGFRGMSIYPCDIADKRAFCRVDPARDVVHPPRAPLTRNDDIVKVSAAMIGAPKSSREELRSGTWATVRRARAAGKPIAIVFPNGAVAYDGAAWPTPAPTSVAVDLDRLVVNVRHALCDVYVGRPSDWGNPYSHENDTLARWRVASRAEAIARYEEWLLAKPALLARLPELRGRVLGCWCHPLPCHAMVLARYANIGVAAPSGSALAAAGFSS